MRWIRQKSKVRASPEEEDEPPQEPTATGDGPVEITVWIPERRLPLHCGRLPSPAPRPLAYGCRAHVTYYDAAEQQRACPHAPCHCAEPGCGLAGPPAALRDHLAGAHSLPVDGIRYGAELRLRLPHSDPGQHRRLLAAGDDEGGEVFFQSVGALGDTPLRVVSLMCAPASAAAAAGPRYARTIRAGDAAAGKGSAVLEMAPVPSSAAPGETSMEEAASLVVLRRTLQPAVPGEMQITVRIDRVD